MRISRLFIPLLGAAVAAGWSAPALAWSPEAHQVVARMAALYLTKNAKAQVEDLLDGGGAADAMAKASTWANDIEAKRPETRAWHFVNIPVAEGQYNAERDCPGGNCAIARMAADMKTLGDKAQPEEKRVEALKFLIHLMADLHQPLHCANDDRDHGRQIKVSLDGKSTTLYDVWENDLIKGLDGTPEQLVSRFSTRIDKEHRQAWAYGSLVRWCEESAGQARVNVLDDLHGAATNGKGEIVMSSEYPSMKRRLVSEQLSRAAVRLAAALNSVLK